VRGARTARATTFKVPTSTTKNASSKPRQGRNQTARARLAHWLRRLLVICAFAYPVSLIATCLAFYYIGESWWVTAAALYAPRIFFAAPLPPLLLGLLLFRLQRLLWTQAAAALLTLFPLMGFVLPLPRTTPEGAPTLRLMSFNVNSAYAGKERLMAQIAAISPDILLVQEMPWPEELLEAVRAHYPHAEASTQFIIGSRYPILERTEPAKLPHEGRQRSPRFIRYVVQSPLGKLALYSVHPISPRGTLGVYGLRGVLHRVRTGEILTGDPEADVGRNASLRELQVSVAAGMAKLEKYPVVLAGDMNLPGLSSTLRKHLDEYADGFTDASWGFGYTFPQKYPFLRLDRVLTGPGLRFTEFQVGCPDLSDHFCVVASIQRR